MVTFTTQENEFFPWVRFELILANLHLFFIPYTPQQFSGFQRYIMIIMITVANHKRHIVSQKYHIPGTGNLFDSSNAFFVFCKHPRMLAGKNKDSPWLKMISQSTTSLNLSFLIVVTLIGTVKDHRITPHPDTTPSPALRAVETPSRRNTAVAAYAHVQRSVGSVMLWIPSFEGNRSSSPTMQPPEYWPG